MRVWAPWLILGAALAASGARAAAGSELRVSDETQMPSAGLQALTVEFSQWAQRVNTYLHVRQPAPVQLVFTQRTHVGLYLDDTMYLPPDDHDEMLETFIHEFAHHATGHDSSYFFKEGIASHTLEALFRQDGRLPQGWPQYGVSNDAWINLFLHNSQLLPLQQALDWPHYDGGNAEGDYRSWQIYLMGGSFSGWYIERYGYKAFKQIFDREQLPVPTAQLEQLWLDSLRSRKLPLFDPATQLPRGPRYQGFAQRLPLH